MYLGSLMKLLMLSHASRSTFLGSGSQCRANPLPHPAFAHDPLRDEVQTYTHWGLAWTTNRTYGSGEKRFIQFCLMNRLISSEGDILPASQLQKGLLFISPLTLLGQLSIVLLSYIFLQYVIYIFPVGMVILSMENYSCIRSHGLSFVTRGGPLPSPFFALGWGNGISL